MIKESSEGEFEFSENDTVAMSKNGWVKIIFLINCRGVILKTTFGELY